MLNIFSGIHPVLISKDHTEIVKMIHPLLYFQEFKEEKEERGPISWAVRNNVQKDFSVISGFATDEVKTIIIKNKGDIIQPKRLFLRDNLWVWYITSKEKINLPLNVTVYDIKGHIISGGNEEE